MAKEISIGGGGAALFLCGDQTYRWKTILAGGRDGVDEQTTSTWKRFGGRLLVAGEMSYLSHVEDSTASRSQKSPLIEAR